LGCDILRGVGASNETFRGESICGRTSWPPQKGSKKEKKKKKTKLERSKKKKKTNTGGCQDKNNKNTKQQNRQNNNVGTREGFSIGMNKAPLVRGGTY